jgi:hypothetical protein
VLECWSYLHNKNKKNYVFENSTGRLDVEAMSRYFEKIQICWGQNSSELGLKFQEGVLLNKPFL